MKKLIFTWLIIGAWAQGFAQGNRTVDSLECIINDNRNSPENRVLACVRQGQFYIKKPGEDAKDIDSASACLKKGKQLGKAFNLRTTDGELLFLELRLKTSFNRFRMEILAAFGRSEYFKLLETALTTFYAYVYFRTRRGKRYLERLVAMSDTLVLDGKINTVMSGTCLQREQLDTFLSSLETNKEILYGLQISKLR